MSRPLISIITPVLNRAALIEEAISSVEHEAGPSVEHLVIDGGSTDGTIDVVRRWPRVRLIVAAGAGIYRALNIGVAEAKGEIIGHLNSDDFLPPGALNAVASGFAGSPWAESVRGIARYRLMDERGAISDDFDTGRDYPAHLGLWDIIAGHVAINSIFTRADAYRRIGPYDETLPLSADREWLLRAHVQGLRISQIQSDTYIYRRHAGSLTLQSNNANRRRLRDEALEIAGRYLGKEELAPEIRQKCLAWHAKNAGLAMAEASLPPRWSGLRAIRRCFSTDPYWPIRFLRQVPALAVRRALRYGRPLLA